MEKIVVNKLPITLAQFMKWAGLVITGGEAKEIIREGLVKINGVVCEIAGKKLDYNDLITIEMDEVVEFKIIAPEAE